MMDSENDLLVITISKSDLFDMIIGVIMRTERFIELQAPKVIINRAIERLERYTKVLEEAGYDHWAEKINQVKEKAHYDGIQ